MKEIGIHAKQAASQGNTLTSAQKNKVLEDLKLNLNQSKQAIFTANQKDLDQATQSGLTSAMIDRLSVNDTYLQGMIQGIDDIIGLVDPIGKVLEKRTLDNGIDLEKVSVPLGVVGIIYESRPNVTVDAFALNFKVGNACILKGGKEAIHTNIIFETIIQKTLIENNLDPHLIQLIKDVSRESTMKLMKMNDYVDVLIPRGSQGLIDTVLKESTIPVIETGAGNCHIFVDESADQEKALKIIENAKLQRPGVCNALESLVVHEKIASEFIPKLISYLDEVSFKGDEVSQTYDDTILAATPEDFYMEYLDKVMSIKVVADVEEAIEHINTHHTAHSDAILTQNESNANLFTQKIDAAAVYVNASTRFTDGFVFGLGAEIGISTQKLHARGPMGLEALTTYKYILKGNGQVR